MRGRSVLLVDQYGPGNARASSGGESRILRMGYGDKAIYTEWAWRASAIYRQVYDEIGPELLVRSGVIWLCQANEESSRHSASVMNRLHIPYQVFTADEIVARYPQMDCQGVSWGLYEPEGGALMARRGVQAIVREAVSRGVVYRTDRVAALSSRLAKVEVYACGPWLPSLFPELLAAKFRVTRQEVFYFGPPAGSREYASPQLPGWIDGANGVYGLPDLEGRGLKIGLDRHGQAVDPDSQERNVSGEGCRTAREYLRMRFPSLSDAPLVGSEVCQYENTANGDYVIDRHPQREDTWLLGGGSGHGYKHGPAVAEYVAAALEDSAPLDPIFSLAAKPEFTTGSRSSTIPPR